MTRSIRLSLLVFLLSFVFGSSVFAAIELRQFDTPEQEKTYRELIFELRCLVCQNQNLADSNAELAVDLRRQTYEMLENGADKQDVIDYMVERYGEFVLYRPPFTASTLLLWVGPFMILVAGMIIVIRIVRNKKQEPAAQMSAEEQAQVRALLNNDD